jgi:D-3-phosphoglycerate dehydrogenase
MIALAKNLAETTASMRAGKWEKKRFQGSELNGKTLGVIGLGRIGAIVARRMQGFGMKVIAHDPYKTEDAIRDLDCEPATIDEICERADFITLHTPKTSETANVIGPERLAKMKKGARLVNCARGGLVDEAALAKALESGHLAGAALDVFEAEPPDPKNPLLALPNVVMSPHLGAATTEAQEQVAVDVAKQIVDALRGGPVINAVNYPSIDPEIIPKIRPHMDLAHALGCAINQLCKGTKTKALEIAIAGDVTEYPVRPIALEVMRGFLKRTSDVTINYVNAIPLIEARGIKPTTVTKPECEDFSSLITVRATGTEGEVAEMSGTLYSQREPRIVRLNQQRVDASPEGNLILIENRDVPGVVGAVGTLLAKHGVNIGQLNLGVDEQGRRALTIVKVDQPVDDAVIEGLSGLDNILSVRALTL